MSTAADIIAALLPRKPVPTLEKQTHMPYGWGPWLRGLREQRGAITHEREQALSAVAGSRPVAAQGREREMGKWGAFASLFHQGWRPPEREERGLRWFGRITSLLLHLCFAAAILWLSWVNIPPYPTKQEEETRTRLEYIGDGTPGETGGGQPGEAAPAAAAQSAPASRSEATASNSPPQATTPKQAQATAEVQASEVETPAEPVQVPMPRITQPVTPAPSLPTPVQQVQEREVVMIEVPAVQQIRPRERDAPSVATPTLPQVREREIDMPVAAPEIRQLQSQEIAVKQREARAPSVREREVAMPSAKPTPAPAASVPAAAPQPAATAANTTPNPATSQKPAAAAPAAAHSNAAATQKPSGSDSRTSSTVAGPVTGPKPGAAPSMRRADDWGDSTRSQAGQPGSKAGDGLFNADGKPNLPGDLIGQSTTQPGVPGSRQAAARDAAAAGAFLKRVPYPYEPTMFDKDWVPRENLLQEWVRKNIREVEVSIPGTSKKVRCVVSLLQLGGGCSMSDGNLHDQPAVARPPPEIPVKRNPIKTDS